MSQPSWLDPLEQSYNKTSTMWDLRKKEKEIYQHEAHTKNTHSWDEYQNLADEKSQSIPQGLVTSFCHKSKELFNIISKILDSKTARYWFTFWCHSNCLFTHYSNSNCLFTFVTFLEKTTCLFTFDYNLEKGHLFVYICLHFEKGHLFAYMSSIRYLFTFR